VKTLTPATATAPLGILLLLAACSTSPDPDHQSLRGVERAEASVAQPRSQSSLPPPALIQGTPVTAADLAARLEEAGGSVVLEEIALDRLLDKAVADSAVAIPQHDVDAERQFLVQTLTDEAKLTPEQADSMLSELRKSRGLGPVRFADLLARNAKLRALVRTQVEVTPDEVDQSLAAEFGPKARIRIITAPTQRRAAEIRDIVVKDLKTRASSQPAEAGVPQGPQDPMIGAAHFDPADLPALSLCFAQAALDSSTDPTAPRGGLIASVSPVDQGLPPSVRAALATMQPGDLSGVLTTERGAMLVLLESRTDAEGSPTPNDRARAEARVRFRKERIAMDRLARQLLGLANVSPMDPSLRWSWESRAK
jgi:hypothetical protein